MKQKKFEIDSIIDKLPKEMQLKLCKESLDWLLIEYKKLSKKDLLDILQ